MPFEVSDIPNWIIPVVFLLAFLGSVVALEKKADRRKQQAAAANQQNHSGGQKGGPPNKPHPDEHQHRSNEEAYWSRHLAALESPNWINRLTFMAAGIAAIGAIGGYCEAKRQADIAQSNLIASSRAWINFNIDPSDRSFTWGGPNGPAISLRITGTNEGNSPALNAVVMPVLAIRHFNSGNIRNIVKQKCKLGGYFGNVIFKNDSIPQEISTSIEWKEVNQYREEAARVNKIPANSVNWTTIYLIVCASYYVIGSADEHYTGRVYELRRVVFDNVGAPRPVDIPIGQDVAGQSLILERNYEGDYAD